jgi:steroid delta-isomerase-like uncharacterized protein
VVATERSSGELVDRFFDALNHRDVEALTSLAVDGGAWIDYPIQRVYPDLASGFTGQLGLLAGLSSDYVFTVSAYAHLDQGTCTAEWEFSGTHDRDYEPFALQASGKAFQVKGVAIFVFENGRISEVRIYYDLWGFFAQIGLPRAGPFAWPLEAWIMERDQERPAPIE